MIKLRSISSRLIITYLIIAVLSGALLGIVLALVIPM